jgi:hypothetical protein
MPLFIQSLPLSFQTFWRYLILLPFLAALCFSLYLLILVPFLGYVVPGTISALCLLVGFRVALAARGHYAPPDIGQLLSVSLGFCILNILFSFLLEPLAFVFQFLIGAVISPVLGLLSKIPLIGDYVGAAMILSLLFSTAVVVAFYTSFLAVPMTSAAAAIGQRRGRAANPVDGFGTGLFSLMLITCVWFFVGQWFAIFGEVGTTFLLMLDALTAYLNGDEIGEDWTLKPGTLLGGTLFMAWASSWFFATSVLAWEKATARREVVRKESMTIERISPDSLRALREARERGQRGPMG